MADEVEDRSVNWSRSSNSFVDWSQSTNGNRALAALWNIRMEAERLTVDGDVTAFLQRIIHHAESGMAGQRTEAQQAAHNQERGT